MLRRFTPAIERRKSPGRRFVLYARAPLMILRSVRAGGRRYRWARRRVIPLRPLSISERLRGLSRARPAFAISDDAADK